MTTMTYHQHSGSNINWGLVLGLAIVSPLVLTVMSPYLLWVAITDARKGLWTAVVASVVVWMAVAAVGSYNWTLAGATACLVGAISLMHITFRAKRETRVGL